MAPREHIMGDGTTVPGSMLIGVVRGQWPIKLFYNNELEAADWLATSDSDRKAKHVYRVDITPVHEMTYIPPTAAQLLESKVSSFTTRGEAV